jgi:hypothetical protein
MTTTAPLCLHCERAPSANALGLCATCYSRPRVRRVYVKTARKSPERITRLNRLRERAAARLPLFEDNTDANGNNCTPTPTACQSSWYELLTQRGRQRRPRHDQAGAA